MLSRKYFERVKRKGNYSPLDCAIIFTEASGFSLREMRELKKKVDMLIKRRHFSQLIHDETRSRTSFIALNMLLFQVAPNSKSSH